MYRGYKKAGGNLEPQPEPAIQEPQGQTQGWTEPPGAASYDLPQAKGTIVPWGDFSEAHIEEQCEELRKAMKGIGTDEYRIITVLTKHNNDQRQIIQKAYTTAYGKHLLKELDSELSGNFRELVRALMKPAREYDAYCLRVAMEDMGTNEQWLIELLCPRTNEEIRQIQQAYLALYPKRVLEDDLRSETSGIFERIIVSVATGNRESAESIDEQKVQKDAKDLYDAGEGKLGTDDAIFNRIFALRSWPHMRALCKEYTRISGRELAKSVESEFSFNAKKSFVTIVLYALDPIAYFTDRIHSCLGSSASLIRLIASHSETDLADIRQKYQAKYRVTLESAIQRKTSGDYERLLVKIVNPLSNAAN